MVSGVERRESPQEVVQRFIIFTKRPFREGEFFGDVMWEAEMNELYGNPDLFRSTGRFRGVEGISRKFEEAYNRGGLNALKGEFFAQALEHTDIAGLRGPSSIIFERIIAFE